MSNFCDRSFNQLLCTSVVTVMNVDNSFVKELRVLVYSMKESLELEYCLTKMKNNYMNALDWCSIAMGCCT